jgi:molybdopterin adenylyltransferase
MSHVEHKARAPHHVRCFVLTISDTRTEETDTAGKAIRDLLEEAGHTVSGHAILPDDADSVRQRVQLEVDQGDAHAIITTGGTGVSSRDTTYEALVRILNKRLDGFGELFRMLSYQDIGSAAMLSRAVAGTVEGKIVFALPGAEGAVRLAMQQLILPELGHLVQQLKK